MDRRQLLFGTTAAGFATACSTRPLVSPPPALLPDDEVQATWSEILRTRDALGTRDLPMDDVLRRGRTRARSGGRVLAPDDVATKATRTLFLSGAFRDLPIDMQAHPIVQASMFDAAPEFDDAIRGMKARLDRLTPTERADLARAFRDDPELAERVVGLLDVRAVEAGVSDLRRLHLRRVGVDVCDRLNQSSTGLLDEYGAKLDKVYARFGDEVELERKLAAAIGAEAFDRMKARMDEATERYRVAGVMRISGQPPPPSNASAKRGTLVAGLVFIGLGVVGGAISPFTLFISATVGGVFLLAGIVLLIVSAVL